jgi:hypothetical protein
LVSVFTYHFVNSAKEARNEHLRPLLEELVKEKMNQVRPEGFDQEFIYFEEKKLKLEDRDDQLRFTLSLELESIKIGLLSHEIKFPEDEIPSLFEFTIKRFFEERLSAENLALEPSSNDIEAEAERRLDRRRTFKRSCDDQGIAAAKASRVSRLK